MRKTLSLPVDAVKSRTVKIARTGCWQWTGYICSDGYGGMKRSGKLVRAHRLSYEAFKGPIPSGLSIDHLCRNKLCVNPEHLEAVSIRENTLRGIGPSAENARKMFCINGHILIGDNVTMRPRKKGIPYRRCKTCHREGNARYRNSGGH